MKIYLLLFATLFIFNAPLLKASSSDPSTSKLTEIEYPAYNSQVFSDIFTPLHKRFEGQGNRFTADDLKDLVVCLDSERPEVCDIYLHKMREPLSKQLHDPNFIKTLNPTHSQTLYKIMHHSFTGRYSNFQSIFNHFKSSPGPYTTFPPVVLFYSFVSPESLMLRDFVYKTDNNETWCFLKLKNDFKNYNLDTPLVDILEDICDFRLKDETLNGQAPWDDLCARLVFVRQKSAKLNPDLLEYAETLIQRCRLANPGSYYMDVRDALCELCNRNPILYRKTAVRLIENSDTLPVDMNFFTDRYLTSLSNNINTIDEKELRVDIFQLWHCLYLPAAYKDPKVCLLASKVLTKLITTNTIGNELAMEYMNQISSLVEDFISKKKDLEEFYLPLLRLFEEKLPLLTKDLSWMKHNDSPNYRLLSYALAFYAECFGDILGLRALSESFLENLVKAGMYENAEGSIYLTKEISDCYFNAPLEKRKALTLLKDIEDIACHHLYDAKLTSKIPGLKEVIRKVISGKSNGTQIPLVTMGQNWEELANIVYYLTLCRCMISSNNEKARDFAYSQWLDAIQHLEESDLDYMSFLFPNCLESDIEGLVEATSNAYGDESEQAQKLAEISVKLGGESSIVYRDLLQKVKQEAALILPVFENMHLCPTLFEYKDDLTDIPAIGHNEWLLLCKRFQSMGEGSEFEKLIKAAEDQFFNRMLTPAQSGIYSNEGLMLKHIIAYLNNLKDTDVEVDGTSKFYTAMSGLLYSVLNCDSGKKSGISLYYRDKILGQSIHLGDIKKDLASKELREKIRFLVKRYVGKLISKDGPVLLELCEVENAEEIIEAPHQEAYLKAVIGQALGLLSPSTRVAFDPYGHNVVENLRTLSKQQLLDKVSSHLNVENVVAFIAAEIADGKKSQDETLRAQTLNFESILANILDENERYEYYLEDEDSDDESEENALSYSYTLSNKGIEKAFVKLGVVLKSEEIIE